MPSRHDGSLDALVGQAVREGRLSAAAGEAWYATRGATMGKAERTSFDQGMREEFDSQVEQAPRAPIVLIDDETQDVLEVISVQYSLGEILVTVEKP